MPSIIKNLKKILAGWGLFGLIILIIGFIVGLIIYPQQTYQASWEGLIVWWNIVLPASLPFFIGSQVLIGLGVVHFLSIILAPLMRPLFNVPGAGAFALTMGLSSGNPLGAAITADLRKKNLCSKTEGERLICFTNNANLLFMKGAVAVGIFKMAELGIIFVFTHYLATFFTAIIYRFYKFKKHSASNIFKNNKQNFSKAVEALQKARKEDGRSFGRLLGDAVNKSISTLLMIGGFIVVFSVLIKILKTSGLVKIMTVLILPVLNRLGLDPSLGEPLISSFFEITNGIKMISISTAVLEQKILLTCAVISWSGLSIQTQVASVIADSDLSILPYLFSRVIHSILSFFIAFIILNQTNLLEYLRITKPVFATLGTSLPNNWLESLSFGLIQFLILCLFLFIFILLNSSFFLMGKIKKQNR